MSDAAIRQRERVCAAEGCVPGVAPASTAGPLPLTLRAPKCERCGRDMGPTWRLDITRIPGYAWARLLADNEPRSVHYRVGDTRVCGAIARESLSAVRAVIDEGSGWGCAWGTIAIVGLAGELRIEHAYE